MYDDGRERGEDRVGGQDAEPDAERQRGQREQQVLDRDHDGEPHVVLADRAHRGDLARALSDVGGERREDDDERERRAKAEQDPAEDVGDLHQALEALDEPGLDLDARGAGHVVDLVLDPVRHLPASALRYSAL